MATISGRMMVYSPVSSNRITTAVIGVRAAPANTAPMPTSAYAPGGPVTWGSTWWARVPNAAPSIAPMNREGANTPPEPPMPMVRLVARILPSARMSRNARVYRPATAWPSTG